MRRVGYGVLALLCVVSVGLCATPETAQRLQTFSVTIHAGPSQGSGVVCDRGGVSYILTAGHVIESLRREEKKEGGKPIVTFEDPYVVSELYEKFESVGETRLRCEVLRYSNADSGEDLALLRVKKTGVLGKGTTFLVTKDAVPVGTELLHCGSLLGQGGSNSVTRGIVSQIGRTLKGTVYDQSSCGAFPGSSGGGIFRSEDGVYVGMLVRGAGETFNLFVPMRRILPWAERNGVSFIFDPSKDVPSEKELKSKPVEEVK